MRDGMKIRVSTELSCDRCKATLLTLDDLFATTDPRFVERYKTHLYFCSDSRIERYIGEVFPMVEDIVRPAVISDDGQQWPVRSFNLGRSISHRNQSTEAVDAAMHLLAARVLEDMQSAFGPKARGERFYWRERPNFSTWYDGNTRATLVALWFGFAVEGWDQGKSVREFVGADSNLWTLHAAGELATVTYMEDLTEAPCQKG